MRKPHRKGKVMEARTGDLLLLKEDCWLIAGYSGCSWIAAVEPSEGREPPQTDEEMKDWLRGLDENHPCRFVFHSMPLGISSYFNARRKKINPDDPWEPSLGAQTYQLQYEGDYRPWKIYTKGDPVGIVRDANDDTLDVVLIGSVSGSAKMALHKGRAILCDDWEDEFVSPDDLLEVAPV